MRKTPATVAVPATAGVTGRVVNGWGRSPSWPHRGRSRSALGGGQCRGRRCTAGGHAPGRAGFCWRRAVAASDVGQRRARHHRSGWGVAPATSGRGCLPSVEHRNYTWWFCLWSHLPEPALVAGRLLSLSGCEFVLRVVEQDQDALESGRGAPVGRVQLSGSWSAVGNQCRAAAGTGSRKAGSTPAGRRARDDGLVASSLIFIPRRNVLSAGLDLWSGACRRKVLLT